MIKRNEKTKKTVITIASGEIDKNGFFFLPTEFTQGDIIYLDDYQKTHSESLIRIEGDYPQNMRDFTLQNFENLTNIPSFNENLTVETVTLENCVQLEAINGAFPNSLKHISLSNCTNLKEIASLPRSLMSLNLANCENLENIPLSPDDLPWDIQDIFLNGCDRLVQTPELIGILRELEDEGCNIDYPDHFELSDAILEMKHRLSELGTLDDMKDVEDLLFYIVTQDPDERSAKTELEDQYRDLFDIYVDPILSFLEVAKEKKDYNSLEWVKNIASIHLTGCVNQPVAGVTEILSWISVANEKHLIHKIEASKEILTLDTIKQFISDYLANPDLENDDRIEPIVEVEAGNVLLREVYDKLKSDKILGNSVYWKSVPEKVANEQLVSTWITKNDKISQACYLVNEKVLKKPAANIAEDMCENFHQDIWSKLCFPEKILELQSRSLLKKELYTLVFEGKLAAKDINEVDKDVAEFLQEHSNKKYIQDYYTLLSSQNINDLEEIGKNFELQERADILQLSRDLTLESIFSEKVDFIHYSFRQPSLHKNNIAEILPEDKKFHAITLEDVTNNFQESLHKLILDNAEKIIFSLPILSAENEAENHLGIYITREPTSSQNMCHVTCIELNNNVSDIPTEILECLKATLEIEQENIDHVSIKQDHIPRINKETNNLSVISYSLTELAKGNIDLENIAKNKKQKEPTSAVESPGKGEQLSKKSRFM